MTAGEKKKIVGCCERVKNGRT